jgi:hypothetical protein
VSADWKAFGWQGSGVRKRLPWAGPPHLPSLPVVHVRGDVRALIDTLIVHDATLGPANFLAYENAREPYTEAAVERAPRRPDAYVLPTLAGCPCLWDEPLRASAGVIAWAMAKDALGWTDAEWNAEIRARVDRDRDRNARPEVPITVAELRARTGYPPRPQPRLPTCVRCRRVMALDAARWCVECRAAYDLPAALPAQRADDDIPF